MMTRRVAVDSALLILAEVKPPLASLWNAEDRHIRLTPGLYRKQLERIRDRVHAGCQHFHQAGGTEQHEDLYDPLVDALAFLNISLGTRPFDRDPLGIAIDRLDDLDEIVSAAPAGVRAGKGGVQ